MLFLKYLEIKGVAKVFSQPLLHETDRLFELLAEKREIDFSEGVFSVCRCLIPGGRVINHLQLLKNKPYL